MVPSWFLWIMYLLIAGTCSLLIPDEIGWLFKRFGQLQLHPALHAKLKEIIAIEAISFVSLFGIGATLLGFHRFESSIWVFATGSAVLAAGMLLAAFSLKSSILKCFCVVLISVGAICMCKYLMGIVEQGRSEYYAAEDEKGDEKLKLFLEKSKSKPALEPEAPKPEAKPEELKQLPIRTYDLTGRRHDVFLALLNTQLESRDTIRVGCIGWIEDSCIAAGKFLLLFSEAGWKIDSGRVFRFDPAIPPEGMTIAAKSPRYTDNLPPHLGHWGAMDASQVTFWQAFWWMQIPVGASGDPDMPEGTIGIYFGPEPKNVNVRTTAQTQKQLTQVMGWVLIQLMALERTCSTQIDICKTKELQWAQFVSVLLDNCDCGLTKSWSKKWKDVSNNPKDDAPTTIARQDKELQRFVTALNGKMRP